MASRRRNSSPEPASRSGASISYDDDGPPESKHRSSGFRQNRFIKTLTFKTTSSPSSSGPPRLSSQRRSSFRGFHEEDGPNGLHCVYEPREPLVDLIFVHGLNGDSYRTWRKHQKPGFFWPGEWLPQDQDFRNVRIHTFGYPADWTSFRQRGLSMNDFANSLHSAMLGSEHLARRGDKTHIILIGHSMGGLVIKKTCRMFQREAAAGQDPHHANLHRRIKCLMFLATPHRGSDMADRLDKVLRAGLTPMNNQHYIGELRREAPANQEINEDFKFIADNYQLYSFYETRPVPHLGEQPIVAKDSACMDGPTHEITVMMEADHRSICKFENQEDICYETIRNQLVTVIFNLLGSEAEPDADDLDPLDVFLDCEGIQDETLETILEAKIPESCKWIEQRDGFAKWVSSEEARVWVYWLNGSPGTGKSVTSAHIVNLLQEERTPSDVCSFFFVNGNKLHKDVATLLRCIAVQMAKRHPLVNQALRKIQKSGTHFEDAEAKTIWQKLFVSCILKLPLDSPQFWVIDALDECYDFAKLFLLLKTVHPSFPLRIFLTSRLLPDIRDSIQRLPGSKVTVTTDAVTPEDTEEDIRRLLKSREEDIPLEDNEKRADTAEKIVRNSQGSFLWANVILRDMKKAYSVEEIEAILANVPDDMVPHYDTILEHMSTKHPGRKTLIHAILTWAVCGARPLDTKELQEALKLDIGENVTLMQKAVEDFCGQLLIINKHGAVKLIHSTVREFLLDEDQMSEYSIDREEGNRRLASACLKYLAAGSMRRKTLTGFNKSKTSIADRVGPFAEYAATQFSLHLVRGPADDDHLFELLAKFLRSPNVLYWIEFVAVKFKSLEHIKEAGANLRRYLERRSKHRARLGIDFSTVQKWSVDLIRIVSKFGQNILDSPSQMHLLVPAICPPISAMYEQFSSRNPELHVVGISDAIWADAISYIEHVDTVPTSMTCGTHYVAIGQEGGLVRIFNTETIVELASFNHGERIVSMKFDNSGQHLITSGESLVTYWDLSDNSDPKEVWSRELMHPCLSFFFTDDDEELLATTKGNYLLILPIDGEEEERVVPLTFGSNKAKSSDASLQPKYTSFSPDGTRVAFAYNVSDNGPPIFLWNFAEGEASFFGRCGRQNADVQGLIFNPNPELEHLVVTYKKGVLALIDYNTLKEDRFIQAEPFSLSATLDGQTLATGSARGFIELWDFETLTLLYLIKYHSQSVGDMRFSSDGRRLFDIRDTHSVVWEPAALIRNTDEDDDASASGCSVSFKLSTVEDYEDPVEISAVALNSDPSIREAIVGKGDGSVCVYSLETGKQIEELFRMDDGSMGIDLPETGKEPEELSGLKPKRPVLHIALSQDGFIACADQAANVLISKRQARDESESDPEVTVLQTFDFGEPLQQLLFSGSGKQLLVSGSRVTQIWEFDGDSEKFILVSPFNSPSAACWWFFACPDDPNQFQCVDKEVDEFLPREVAHPGGMLRTDSIRSTAPNSQLRIRNAVVDPDTKLLVVEYEGAKSTRHLIVLEKTQVSTVPEPGLLSPPTSPIGAGESSKASKSTMSDCYRMVMHLKPSQMRMFLGLYKGKAVYLGPHLWIRTLDLVKSVRKKHFFIPHEYIGGNHRVQAAVGFNGEVVFPRRGELAVIHGGHYYFSRDN